MYKSGKHNTNADALSRAIITDESTQDINQPQCLALQLNNPTYEYFLQELQTKIITNNNVIEKY